MNTINDTIANYQFVLFPYAYNIMGSVEEAEDIVQDILIKHFVNERPDSTIHNEKNYLIKSVINRAISTKKRKSKMALGYEQLPEPIATEASDADVYLNDIASYALLVILERLNVKERAVFILKEAFHYSHKEIAEVISGTSENSRKLLSRAKAKLDPALRNEVKISRTEANAYLKKYVSAIRNGDIKTLETMFSEDIRVIADGGGTVKVISQLTIGSQECMALLLEVYRRFQKKHSVVFTEVNHQPAILFYNGKNLVACQVFSIGVNNKIYAVDAIVDPKKLKNLIAA